jgi:hypothetical protein
MSRKQVSGKRALGVIFYGGSLIIFTGFLLLLFVTFWEWALGLIFLFFISLAAVFMGIIYMSAVSLIRIVRRRPSLEERVALLEGALYANPNDEK